MNTTNGVISIVSASLKGTYVQSYVSGRSGGLISIIIPNIYFYYTVLPIFIYRKPSRSST